MPFHAAGVVLFPKFLYRKLKYHGVAPLLILGEMIAIALKNNDSGSKIKVTVIVSNHSPPTD